MKRSIDLLLGITCLVLLEIPILIILVTIFLTSKGPLLYWSDRVDKNNKIFNMPKFRSMLIGTPVVAAQLMSCLSYSQC